MNPNPTQMTNLGKDGWGIPEPNNRDELLEAVENMRKHDWPDDDVGMTAILSMMTLYVLRQAGVPITDNKIIERASEAISDVMDLTMAVLLQGASHE